MDSLVRYLRIGMGTGIFLLGVGGYIPLLFLHSVGTSQPHAALEEMGTAASLRSSTDQPVSSRNNPSSEASAGNYDAFHEYINEESEQAQAYKSDAKRRNNPKSNSFGVWGEFSQKNKEIGVKVKHRF